MFEHLEAENLGVSPVVERRALAVSRLWAITEKYNTLHKSSWDEEVRSVVAEYQEQVVQAVDRCALHCRLLHYLNKLRAMHPGRRWLHRL